MEIDAPNPRAPRRRTSLELTRAVRDGRRVNESLRLLDQRAERAEDGERLLAAELARFLVRRCEGQHAGWRVLRQVLLDGGADVAWERCARLAWRPTAARVLRDCARPGRTPLLRVQHAAAEERARILAGQLDPVGILERLEIRVPTAPPPPVWEEALVGAVTARSREQALRLLAAGVTGVRLPPAAATRGRARRVRASRPER
ncbi:MAG: hypothetical protein QOF77_677 [Solirubrobacteraceae bacterium]|jgi:hypothetical protein|nr:hypothetical protein [Solirubrobacteraceae bacterium]